MNNLKKILFSCMASVLPLAAMAKLPEPPAIEIGSLDITGRVEEGNFTFDVVFTAKVNRIESPLPLARGAVSLTRCESDMEKLLTRDEAGYLLAPERRGTKAYRFGFAAKAQRDGDLLMAGVTVPDATLRHVSIQCGREDLDIHIDHAVDVKRENTAAGIVVSAFLPPGEPLVLRWRPLVHRLSGELVVECDANLIAVARAGALRMDSLYVFRVAQGQLSKLAFDVPAGQTITQVRGADLREWAVQPGSNGTRVLTVTLSRPQEQPYPLQIEHELALPALPCAMELAPLAPRDVLRASGFVQVGADGAVRMLVKKAAGLTQIDQAAFPQAAAGGLQRTLPAVRGGFAYQFAGLPFQLSLGVEDIVASLHAEERLVFSVSDNDATLEAAVEIDVRDAPAREALNETEPTWNVTAVEGANVADYDVRDEAGVRKVRVVFRSAATGVQLVQLRLERVLPADGAPLPAPRFAVAGAKAERGFVVLRGELGMTLRPASQDGLRDVQTGTLPVKTPDAQYAARFKAPGWTLSVAVVREQPSIDAEILDLNVFGESGVYGSSLITYLVNGAPVRTLRLAIPSGWRNVEITGRDVRSWRNDGTNWVVTLQEKIIGGYTLLVTHDQPSPYAGGEVDVGGLRALDAANEGGYLVLAAPPGIALAGETNRGAGLLAITPEELPAEYQVLVKDPVLRAEKYAGPGHTTRIAFRRYDARDLLDHAADLVQLNTRLSREGELVTELSCHVKNASQQYLGLTLPKGARLWSATVDGQKVRALERGGGKLLIPLQRRQDPNETSLVAVTYASQCGEVGLRKTVVLDAPALDARTIYARWGVAPPEKHTIVSAGGGLTPPRQPETGLIELGRRMIAVAPALLAIGQNSMILVVAMVLLAAMLAFLRGSGRQVSRAARTATIVVIFLLGVMAVNLRHRAPAFARASSCEQVMPAGTNEPWYLSTPVALADGGLQLGVTVERIWLYRVKVWSLPALGLLIVAGLIWKARRNVWAWGVGLAVAAACATQNTFVIDAMAGLVLGLLGLAVAAGIVRLAHRIGQLRPKLPPALPPPDEAEAIPVDTDPQGGFVQLRMMVALCAITGAACLAMAQNAAPVAQMQRQAAPKPVAQPAVRIEKPAPVALPQVTVRRVKASVELPAPPQDPAKPVDALIELTLSIHAEKPGELLVLPKDWVMTGSSVSSPRLSVFASSDGYRLRVDTTGDHTATIRYRAAACDAGGAWRTALWLPPHLVNEVTVKLPTADWVLESDGAVYLHAGENADAGTARLVAAGPRSMLTWRPRPRRTSLEKASFFAELNTVARVQPGLVTLTHFVRLQIAQGEVRDLRFEIPAGSTVTAVSGPGLGTWRFDPAARLLEAVLEKPVSGEYALRLVTQAAREGLPYSAEIREIVVRDAARQRGVLALVADEGVQIVAGEPAGCATMWPGDFPQETLAAEGGGTMPDVKRAYRYQAAGLVLKIDATRVETELRASEEARVDINDERVVLSSRLRVDIAKAGVFTLNLDLPEGFDIDSLSGEDVSHWDEIREGGRAVAVHFSRQALGARSINVVLSRQERGVRDELDIPRLSVRGALKHTGTLVVAAELGLRLSAMKREGASELNPRDIGIQQAGNLAYRLLRPDWALRLRIEAAQPVIKAELLQAVTVSEGMMQARCRVQYAIEHAGVRTFRLAAPAPGIPLVVTGPRIARIQESATNRGVWEIELQAKTEGAVSFDVVFQEPYVAASGKAVIRPLRALDAESQKSYLAVLSGSRLEIKAAAIGDGLTAEDARAIPGRLCAEDLSGASLCFRATRADVELPISIVRHETADVLAAKVQSADLVSVLASDGSLGTVVKLKMDNGSLRFLSAKLPKDAEVWFAFVNGCAVKPLAEGGSLLIPLTGALGVPAEVELAYGSKLAGAGGAKCDLPGPSFNLPLQNVTWKIYAPPGAEYRTFGGTLNHRDDEPAVIERFTPEIYENWNRHVSVDNKMKATAMLQQGQELSKQGRQDEARQALWEANAYAQQSSDKDLNEDTRIQFRSVARQQAVAGLATRRSAMKIAKNAAVQEDIQQTMAFNGGNFAADVGLKFQQNLGAKENDSLTAVADKVFDQQVAATADVHPVRVTLPIEGRLLTFDRALLVQPDGELRVTFTADTGVVSGGLVSAGALLGAALLFALAARMGLGRKTAI